ncbi:GntR family transcriptional regulator [Arthrobacter crystallopoietes BAB-32]|uniref:GntR family transcriptional regulator n=1 Tax=Arthrobacter crystallopoietes BAB-32 TaxID=1246476 RepID=N1V2D0_9MICC|nr:GntR family transcriptional regulator [Arthrobacter crystallopoietes]EMY34159.1 GntR family transcriptional regulator [Arthrobacter crystallopoietes BAB-32]
MADPANKRPPTAQAFALAELRRMIIAGELEPGQPLRQDALADRLGVSRVPLREAFKILEGEGQIVYEPHRGFKVARLSLEDLLEVYRIRQLLETEAAHAAAERADESVLPAMKDAAREVERAADAADILAMTEANRRFHFVLLSGAGMPRLERLIQVLWDATDTYRFIYYGVPANRQRVEEEHNLIIDAFADRDAERLVKYLNEHRDHAVDALRTFLNRP